MRTVYCFGEALFECKPMVTLVRSPIKYGKIPSTNYAPSLVCVVSRVYLLNLNSKRLICLSHVLLAESDSGVTVRKEKLCGGTPSKILVAPFSWLKILIKKISVREPLSKLQLLSSLGLSKEAKSRIIDKV